MLKRLSLILVAHLAGILAGTLLSAPLNGVSMDVESYAGALVLSPFEMTIGVPIVFRHYSTLAGVLIISGLFVSVVCFTWGMTRWHRGVMAGMFIGGMLWSLGNMPVFWAFLSV
jgi:hypothetical protein